MVKDAKELGRGKKERKKENESKLSRHRLCAYFAPSYEGKIIAMATIPDLAPPALPIKVAFAVLRHHQKARGLTCAAA